MGMLEGSIGPGGSRHKGVVLTLRSSKAQKPFLSSCLAPHSLKNYPLGSPVLGPATPAAPRLRLLPDKAGFRLVRAVGGVHRFCHGDEL